MIARSPFTYAGLAAAALAAVVVAAAQPSRAEPDFAAAFKAINRNGDGRLSREEFGGSAGAPSKAPAKPEGAGAVLSLNFAETDTNQDASVSLAEFTAFSRAAIQKRFLALDANSDGRITLADLRRVLTIAHEGESIQARQPGLQSAHNLFGVMRDAGLAVEFTESGERFPLKPGAELAIYRILQSALANALKHGGAGTEARVSFTWTQDGLQLLIDDDGIRAAAKRESASPSDVAARTAYTIDDDLRALSESISGAGITQMRERAQLFGGIFNAGTVPGVGFSVSAVFPSLRFHNGVHGVDLAR